MKFYDSFTDPVVNITINWHEQLYFFLLSFKPTLGMMCCFSMRLSNGPADSRDARKTFFDHNRLAAFFSFYRLVCFLFQRSFFCFLVNMNKFKNRFIIFIILVFEFLIESAEKMNNPSSCI